MYNNDNDCVEVINNNKHVPWVFNGDIICLHRKITFTKTTKTLVPEEVKNIIQIYFPKANFFVKATIPCVICRSRRFRVKCNMTRLGLAKL